MCFAAYNIPDDPAGDIIAIQGKRLCCRERFLILKMKKIAAILLSILLIASLAACGGKGTDPADPQNTENNGSDGSSADAATDSSVSAEEVTGEFLMLTADGHYSQEGSKYVITSAGTYTMRGALDGQIVVSAGESEEVVLELSGVTINNSSDSPIKILSADKVEISAKKGTGNVINDKRPVKSAEDDSMGEAAIYAKADLKLKGKGTLVVNASYNNGVHTTKDLTVKNLSLKVTAYNNALKGNDSITIKSGTVVAVSTNGDGLKTTSSDLSKSGNIRGDVVISGGSLAVYAAGDGIQTAHDFIMKAEDGASPNITIFTGSYSGYTAADSSASSFKGVKADDAMDISAGVISISSFDDGLNANYGTSLECGGVGTGNISISGGSVTMTVYSPEGKTGGGKTGPGGRGHHGHQQAAPGADGIHADGELNISGGTLELDSAYEGLEANVINISGGTTRITAVDDGVNACKGQASPLVNVTGGFLDVSVAPNGDVDGIDSNGSYTQSGGVVITRGPNSTMAAAIDAEGGVRVSGGTLIALGAGSIGIDGNVKQLSLKLHSEGAHKLKVNGVSYDLTNAYAYGQTLAVSDTEVTGE